MVKNAITERPLPKARKKRLIKKVNVQILDRLFYMVDNRENINKALIFRIKYLYARDSQLKVKDVMKDDEILVSLITHITASEKLTVDEKIKMIKDIYSHVDCFHIGVAERLALQAVCTIIVFIIINATLHIRSVSQNAFSLFGTYTEPVIIVLSAIFSMFISHYAYMAYINYKSLQQ